MIKELNIIKILSHVKCHKISIITDRQEESLCVPPLVRSDKYFVSSSTCNPTGFSHWLTQSQKSSLEACAHEHGAIRVGAG